MSTPYKTASDAYRAIHGAIGARIEADLEACDFVRAEDYQFILALADMMRDIEAHTDVEAAE